MERQHPGYLIPSLRRIQHLCGISVRNLLVNVSNNDQHTPDLPPDVFFTLSTESGIILYHSEIAEHTSNPSWLAIEWPTTFSSIIANHHGSSTSSGTSTTTFDSSTVTSLLHQPLLKLAIYSRSPRSSSSSLLSLSVSRTSSELQDAMTTVYFPSSASPSFSDSSTTFCIYEKLIDLRELKFLGFDIFYVLAQQQRGISGKRERFDNSSNNNNSNGNNNDNISNNELLQLIPEISNYNLDTLPTNFLVISLEDGQYVLPETYPLILNNPSSSSSTPVNNQNSSTNTTTSSSTITTTPTNSSSSILTEKHDLRRSFDSINRLMQIQWDTKAAEISISEALENIARTLSTSTVQIRNEISTEALSMAVRVAALTRLRDSLHQEVENEEIELIKEKENLIHDTQGIEQAAQRLTQVTKFIDPLNEDIMIVKEDVSILRSLITAKQLSLLAELRTLYPIQEQESGKRYTIRGVVLPQEKEFLSSPEEQISTALGYTCHLIFLIAKYLCIPLRYMPTFMASRSSIKDEVLAHNREWSLYWKGSTDKDNRMYGFKMLQGDTKQILASQGIGYMDNAHILNNLQKLFIILLDVPLPDTM